MPDPQYLNIHNWRKHQSYRADRGMPPWIKIHRSLLRNTKWLSLSELERCHLFSIWILAADNDGRIINDPGIIRRACGLDSEPDLNKLISLGLLDAKARTRKQNLTTINAILDAPEAEAETKAETETEKKESLSVSKKNGRHEYSTEFEEFWKSWKPHKTPAGNKREAWNEWTAVDAAWINVNHLISQASAYTASCRATDTNTKHVCRWLKYRGWEQSYDPPVSNIDMVNSALNEKWKREEEDANKQTGNQRIGNRTDEGDVPPTLERRH